VNRLRTFGFLLKDISRRYVHRFEERARALRLTLPQCRVLVQLSMREGVSQAELADLADLEPMTLVRVLDRMEADGWVKRCSDPSDRRARCLYLTPAGRPLVAEVWRLVDLTRSESVAGLSPEQVEQFIGTMESIRDNLAAVAPVPGSATEAANLHHSRPITVARKPRRRSTT
jgi:MarR family transcriptional regulator, transcriptional regulator for hemolysin